MSYDWKEAADDDGSGLTGDTREYACTWGEELEGDACGGAAVLADEAILLLVPAGGPRLLCDEMQSSTSLWNSASLALIAFLLHFMESVKDLRTHVSTLARHNQSLSCSNNM